MTDTVYRFLPWARRGLASALPRPTGALPTRATLAVKVDVAGAGSVPTSTTLNGPGDVVGLDPGCIVRTVPRPGATNVESNYLAAVDFDQPELPWLFTPSGVPSNDRLPPWLVLVVVEDRPGVAVQHRAGAILPRLTIASGAAAELPDLTDSWAWAHVQVLDAVGGPVTLGDELARHPDRNVSRLVCPRRLRPDTRWFACLVPAYDAGVQRGKGVAPTAVTLAPAWAAGADSVDLPVYFHWEFQTGPEGDFESLARRLKPHEASANVGRVRMHVGDASPFVNLPDGDAGRFLDMDGALQAPAVARQSAVPPVPDPALKDVPAALRTGLADITRLLADAADGKLDGVAAEDGDALGPPVYAGRHARRTKVLDRDPTWFRELNTDPRSRVAAGLGAEVIRTNQEEVVAACWNQVGDVLETEAALSRARLSLELGRRFRARHLEPLSEGRRLQLMAPMRGHVAMDGTSVRNAVTVTSLPDRALDGAMRRLAAPTGRLSAGVARRSTAAGPAARLAGERLLMSLAAGRKDVDATRFEMVAIDGVRGAFPTAPGQDVVGLDRLGVRVELDRASVSLLATASRALQNAPVEDERQLSRPRGDVRATGLLTEAHLATARDAARLQTATVLATLPTGGRPGLGQLLTGTSMSVVQTLASVAAGRTGTAGFVLETGADVVVRPLAVGAGGRLVVVTPPGSPNIAVAHIDRRLHVDQPDLGRLLDRLPDGVLQPLRPDALGGRTVEREPVVVLRPGDVVGDVVADRPRRDDRPPVAHPGEPVTLTVPPLLVDAASIVRFEKAVVVRTPIDPVNAVLVPFAASTAVSASLRLSDPTLVHPARLDTMVRFGDVGLKAVVASPDLLPAWRFPALLDRVMAYPRLDLPAYTYLAAYDRTRFCPGVDEIPPESITLLETNPRFVAAFMAGLNEATSGELMWRGYPTDGRGTSWRKFWRRADDRPDIEEMHLWGNRAVPGGRSDALPAQTSDPRGNLVLLLRGDLIRRYPNTMVVAIRAVRVAGAQEPSAAPVDLRTPVFSGQFDPDVSFFGFPLTSVDLVAGEGWFFGLLEPVTEPRFGFDEPDPAAPAPTGWSDVDWPRLGVGPGGLLSQAALARLPFSPRPNRADGVAGALFQHPFKLLVHAKHLTLGI
jgi:hypothetical protein